MPTVSIPIAASADDQRMLGQGATYPPDSNVSRDSTIVYNIVQRDFVGGTTYYISNILLSFDTGAQLPDTEPVISAILRMYLIDRTGDANGRNICGGYYAWDGTSFSDYTSTPETDAIAAVDISVLNLAADNDFTLQNLSNVSRTGLTKLRLHIDGGIPTGENSLLFASYEHATLSAYAPRLIITYGSTTRLAPDAILSQTNLTGAVSNIQDDPDSADANWLTAP